MINAKENFSNSLFIYKNMIDLDSSTSFNVKLHNDFNTTETNYTCIILDETTVYQNFTLTLGSLAYGYYTMTITQADNSYVERIKILKNTVVTTINKKNIKFIKRK